MSGERGVFFEDNCGPSFGRSLLPDEIKCKKSSLNGTLRAVIVVKGCFCRMEADEWWLILAVNGL